MPPELLGLAVLAALAWLWYDSLKARDAGIAAVRDACQAEGLQLLDETMSIAGLKPARDEDGRLVLRRTYQFEYSDTGDNRRRGSLVMLGQRVLVINIGLRLVPQDRTLH
ncbi:MAG TPA: DUF3301 domain-containing protein [Rhodocyclaceae bacterium]